MKTKIERDYHQAAHHRSLRDLWIAIVSLTTITALVSGCGNATDAKQSASMVSTPSVSSTIAPKQIVSIPKDVVEASYARNPHSTTSGPKATPTNVAAAAEQLRTSRLLHEADQSSSAFRIIGPHTKNVVALYQFFEAAGWNDFLDGLTMKSCPDGYEFFCQTRGIFVEFYEKAGGDVDLLVQLARNMDLREHFYRLASAADLYQAQYQPSSGQASNN